MVTIVNSVSCDYAGTLMAVSIGPAILDLPRFKQRPSLLCPICIVLISQRNNKGELQLRPVPSLSGVLSRGVTQVYSA